MAKDADRPAADEPEDAETDAEAAAAEVASESGADADDSADQDDGAPEDDPSGAGSEDADEEDAGVSGDDAAAERTTSADTKAASASAPAARKKGWSSRLWWALPILMIVEFYAYGRDGRLQICVGKQGHTDFALVGHERTDENRWKFPRCETRLNLGLRSQYDERVAEGIKVACRGATIFRHQGEAKACVAGEQGWEHRVDASFVPPWDPAYYEHLFWFLQ
ncbi:MAG: hypothetical protein H6712_12385 [Myxococcales bacterium]|nr:hypothetical protein [Myxococcales bacterium]MCB9714655.1 hypothetical protein [Myxococcales bacterium]